MWGEGGGSAQLKFLPSRTKGGLLPFIMISIGTLGIITLIGYICISFQYPTVLIILHTFTSSTRPAQDSGGTYSGLTHSQGSGTRLLLFREDNTHRAAPSHSYVWHWGHPWSLFHSSPLSSPLVCQPSLYCTSKFHVSLGPHRLRGGGLCGDPCRSDPYPGR